MIQIRSSFGMVILIGIGMLLTNSAAADVHCRSDIPANNFIAKDALRTLDYISRHPQFNALCSNVVPGAATHTSLLPVPPYGQLNANKCSEGNAAELCRLNRKANGSVAGMPQIGSWAPQRLCPKGQDVPDEDLVELNADKFSYLAKKFQAFVHDPTKQSRCCGGNRICAYAFSKTKLELAFGLGSSESGTWSDAPFFMTFPATVNFSTGYVSGCRTTDCIDYGIYHEMAHVCQSWRQNLYLAKSADEAERPRSTEADLAALVGKDVASCVSRRVRQAFADRSFGPKTPDDLSLWLDEAYADAIFASDWGPSSIQQACDGQEDAVHAAPQVYIGCFLLMPQFRAHFCQEKR